MEPLKIVKKSEVEAEKGTGPTHEYTLNDGPDAYRPAQLSRHVSIPWETIKKRIKIYGLFSELIFYKGRIPKALGAKDKAKNSKVSKKKKKGVYLGAIFAKDGGILTRNGRVIQSNTKVEDELFPNPPECYDGKECHLHAKYEKQADPNKLSTSTTQARAILSIYNAKHYKGDRSFIKTEDFGVVPV